MTVREPANLLIDCKNELGEGIQWHAGHQRVYWTDILGDVLLSCDENGGDFQQLVLDGGLCSFAFTQDGNMLAAFYDGLYWMDPTTGAREKFWDYDPNNPHTRLNDGNLDRQGRFIVGAIDLENRAAITPVMKYDGKEIHEVIQGVAIANSICFSPSGNVMYFADTPTRQIHAYAYDPNTGSLGDRRLFAEMDAQDGNPDGSCVDSAGNLWNAQFAGAQVQGYRPDGTKLASIPVPVPNITCCCIGGAELDKMFITTARIELSDEALEAHPNSGGLFWANVETFGIAHGYFNADN